ncbi:hypothetical protein CLV71_11148 [Actinophytocola oryzae]|uniref:Nucleoside phosphorylase domain-containing protein n=2 Tax=Actinophytocola oryzae TaxID=502181 RepID=A0A4R7VAT1_9PSEU|nr:hypothetical protein CLV71_11148 [Actinophytocola oryzae]
MPAAVGDGWHVGIVSVLAQETRTVLDVLRIPDKRRFHTGRMAVPGGVTYLVVSPPAGPNGVSNALAGLCARYDPAVVVLVGGGHEHPVAANDVVVTSGREPVEGAVGTFFAASGEPASLPGYGGGTAFRVFRGLTGDGEVPRFCSRATTRRGNPLAWAVIRGVAGDAADRNAAQTLRYLIPYLRPRL